MHDIHSINTHGSVRPLFARENDRHDSKCPRCESLNTKFCYYNNYNLSQPRHFCKNCCRYWTKGGVLRNVPVGGGIRKTKRSSKPKLKSSNTTSSKAGALENKLSISEQSSSDNTNPKTATLSTTKELDVSGSNSTNAPHEMILNFDQVTFNQSLQATRMFQTRQENEIITTVGDVKMTEMRLSSMFMDGRFVDERLFDLTGTVDESYWSQDQWYDADSQDQWYDADQ